ncbi:MAG: hypothetical protein EOM52_02495 [Clostridia bacterium]|nr:hypothetical protein [Clostridia bacterium]
MKKHTRKLTALLLTTVLLVQLFAPAFAAVDKTKGNTPEENRAIYEELAALTGGTSEEARALLERLGLLDEKGNLDLTASITLDGEEMTVEEVRALLEEPGTDLTKTVDVDGTTVTLADLKTMLAIEAELARIQETYFSGKTFGAEATENLNSLMSQIENEGIPFNITPTSAAEPETPAWNLYRTGQTNPVSSLNGGGASQTTINLTLTGGKAADKFYLWGHNWNASRISASVKVDGSWKTISGTKLTLTGSASYEIKVAIAARTGYLQDTTSHTSYLHFERAAETDTGFTAKELPSMIIPIEQYNGSSFSWTAVATTAAAGFETFGGVRWSPPSSPAYNFVHGDHDYTIKGNSYLKFPVLLPQSNEMADSKRNEVRDTSILTYLDGLDLKSREITFELETKVALVNHVTETNSNYNSAEWVFLSDNDQPYLVGRDVANAFCVADNTSGKIEKQAFPRSGDGAALGGTSTVYKRTIDTAATELTGMIHKQLVENPSDSPTLIPSYTLEESEEDNRKLLFDSYFHKIVTTTEVPSAEFKLDAPLTNGINLTLNTETLGIGERSNTPTYKAYKDIANLQYSVIGSTSSRYVKNHIRVYANMGKFKMTESSKPTVLSVSVPSDTFYSGQIVPVTVTFSEPVATVSLLINGRSYSGNSGISDTHVVGYRVLPVDNSAIASVKVIASGTADPFGNNMAADATPQISGNAVLVSTMLADAVKSAVPGKASLTAPEAGAGTTLTLSLETADGFQTKYPLYPEDDSAVEGGITQNKAPFVAKLRGGDGTLIPFTLTETTVDGKLTITGATANTGKLAFGSTSIFDIYAYEYDNTAKKWSTVPRFTGQSATVTVAPMVFVNGVTIKDSSDKRELSLTDSHVPTLTVEFTGNPTYETGTWTSSNTKIATINEETGEVILTGEELGTVTFTFTADDGGIEGSTVAPENKKATSETYTVTAGGEAGLVVPKGGDSIIALEKEAAQVRWYGNLKQYLVPTDSDHVTYTVEVFAGNWPAGTDFTQKPPVYSAADLPMSTNIHKIAENTLETLSVSSVPSYTVRISAPHPNAAIAKNGIKLYTYAHIIVNPVPVTVKLIPPTSLYALDSAGTSSVSWDIQNFKAGTTTAKLTVERVDETGAVETVVSDEIITAIGTKSFDLTPVPRNELRALYVVTVTAQNPSDTVWNTDSYQFYVYNSNALDIEVDGAKTDSVTLSNRGQNMDSLSTDTDAIMALRGTLGLNAPISINYRDYAWSALKDGITWSSADDTKVGLNFKQGSFYEDIKRFGYASYLPSTTMAIAGLGETQGTRITATHASTGMSTSIDVKVESLENRLYIFQITPMLETTLTYTDGKGVEKTVTTNNKGTLALYEPDGLKGEVHLRAVDASDDNALYLATFAAENLRSGEGNTLVQELYPLNMLSMRKVARSELYIKKADGTPFTGTVTVRGGVYKNDGYCQDATFAVNDGAHADGKISRTVQVGADGKLKFQMDSTQFWVQAQGESIEDGENLKSSDKLEYIFELTDIDGYYPVLAYIDGVSPVELGTRTGEGVISLEATASNTPQSFLAAQHLYTQDSKRRDVRGRPDFIGPNETNPDGMTLTSIVMLWGETDLTTRDYAVTILDEFGYQPAAQKSENLTYEFSTFPVVRNTLTLTPDSMTKSGWIPEGDPRGLKMQVLKGGTLQKEFPTDLKAADLSNAPALQGETATNIMVELTAGSGVGMPTEATHKNKVVAGLMKRLAGSGESISGPVDTSNFKMIISPGDDSATFKAFIWAGYNSLGLEDVEYDDNGLAVNKHILEQDLTTGFAAEDASALAGGMKEAAETGADLAKNGKSASGGGDFGGQLEGYYEALIKYNFKTQQWEIFTLGGGFTVGFGGSFGKSINQMVGLIPVTASFELGAAIQLDFKMASRYKVMGTGLEWKDGITSQYVTDFLTTLRINAYFEAFGGIGFDISIVALKFGVFGRLGVDNSNAFLSRTYLANESLRQQNGQALKLTGEVGIKFVLTVIGIIDYKATLASVDVEWNKTFNKWDSIQDYWKNTGSGLENQLLSIAAYGAQSGLSLVDASATLQSRDYLSDFERTWGAPRRLVRSLDTTNGLSSLQTNAYPNSLPRITDDGQYLLYAFDQDSTELTSARIYATEKNLSGVYPEGQAINAPDGFTSYGDSDLRLAGTKNFAVAAWISQNTDNELEAGQEVTANIQSVLTNATEVVASVNTGSGWASTRITDNGTPDLAPVVAVGDDKAIVAWRSVYAGDAEQPMDFTTQDNVLYKICDKATNTWGETKTLYPGTSGVVKGIEAAMLSDGTAAVTYTLDRSGVGTPETYEVACTVVDKNGNPGRTLMLTNDSYQDENPQIAAVDCGTAEAPDQRFVIGWYSVHDDNGDIRMAALDANGLPSATFPESLGQISSTAIVGSNFRFVAADKLEDLSILWSVTSQDQDTAGDQLLAVKFLPKDGKIGLSAPIDVATLPKNTNTDHFDAYVSNAVTNEIKAVIQGTEYAPVDENNSATYEAYSVDWEDENGVTSTKTVLVPKGQTKLFTATETYKNAMTLSGLWADYDNLAVNSLVPLQFTVTNRGFETLSSVAVKLDSGAPTDFTVNLAPNESTTLTLYHPTGSVISNVEYSITPTFEGGTLDPTEGTLYLDYPDAGVASLTVVGETEGTRDLRLTLYNAGAAKLNKVKRTLNIEFYDNSLMEGTPVKVNYGNALTDKIIISDADRLALADNGALCVDATFNLDAYLATKDLKENGEVPAAGMRLYAKVWVADNGEELSEFRTGNNTASALMESLRTRTGEDVTITVEQSLTEGKTTAAVTVRNNSLTTGSSGNVVASLLDKNGGVLETLQSYQPNTRAISNGLLSLAGEESGTVTFPFTKEGASVKVTYGALVLNDNTNAALTSLSLTGVPVRLSDFTADPEDPAKYTGAASTAASSTLVTALTQDPGAVVTVNGTAATLDGVPLSLRTGENTITVEITARDGTTKRTYTLTVERTTYDPSSGGTNSYAITATAGEGGSISPAGKAIVRQDSGKTYTITPDQGYEVADVLVDGVSVGKVGVYTFEKVRKAHTIEALFTPGTAWANPFTDVAEKDWFYSAVRFASERGIMNGTGEGRFSPGSPATRGMIVTMLYRQAGSPEVTADGGQWYAAGRAWAMKTGVSDGSGMEAAISREQLVTMLWRNAGSPAAKTGGLSAFTDAARISEWAKDAMAWAVETGLIQGSNGALNPAGAATRAETATMFMRLAGK